MSMINEFAEKLISRLEEKQDEYFHGTSDYEEGKYNAYDEVAQIVNQLAEEYKDVPDTNVGKWILCSERLPEERDWYLAVFKEPYTGFIGLPYIADYLLGKHTAYTTKEGWIIKDCTDGKDGCEYFKELECVAWQPLPEPYKD